VRTRHVDLADGQYSVDATDDITKMQNKTSWITKSDVCSRMSTMSAVVDHLSESHRARGSDLLRTL